MKLSQSIKSTQKISYFNQHMWVDYLELLTISVTDRLLTLSEIKKAISPQLADIDLSSIDESTPSDIREARDKFEERYQDYFTLLKKRSKEYGKNYPFKITNDTIELKEKVTKLQRAYLYLLICSQFSHVPKADMQILASDFEHVSQGALSNVQILRSGPFVYGKSGSNTSSRYRGNSFRRLQSLSDDLKGRLKVSQEDFALTSTGDAGIDIIGWHNPWDKLPSQFIYVGQCKCSDTWPSLKDAKSSIESLIDLDGEVINLYFIPFHFRKATGEWHSKPATVNKVMFDRFRIMKNFPLRAFERTKSYVLIKNFV